MENENAIHIRNVLIIMILTMIIYIVLATIYSFIVTSNVLTLNTPPPVYRFGDVIDNTSDIITNIIKFGLDIVNGSIHMAGHLLNEFATPYKTTPPVSYVTTPARPDITTPATPVDGFQNKKENFSILDEVINAGFIPTTIPEANITTSPIQMTTPTNVKWCYVGNFNGERGCAKIEENDKCPGPVFDDKDTCVSPENSPSNFLKPNYIDKIKRLE